MIDGSGKARYIMIGGFLGAGKTTAVGQLARYAKDKGLRVGLISNDQSSGLVDTTLLRSQGFPVAEIAGGCFCCRFNSLLEAANQLTDESKPDVIIGEPVGSCTDLVATVSYPLRRIYGDQFTTAPLSVLVDPLRCARIMGLEPGRSFSPKVAYVYRKQLQEAGMIVVNKCDTITDAQQAQLVDALRAEFGQADIQCCSALRGDGLDSWFARLFEDEADEDEDGVPDDGDNCPELKNPTQADADTDGVGDMCDNCPNAPNGPDGGTCTAGDEQLLGASCSPAQGCGEAGFCSQDQEDVDGQGPGDACDPTIVPEPSGTLGLLTCLMTLCALRCWRREVKN